MSGRAAAEKSGAMTGANEFKLTQGPEDSVSAVKFSPSSAQFLLVSSWDCTVRLFDVSANSMRMKYQHLAPVLDCAFYDPAHAWSGGLDNQLKTHDLNTDQGEFKHQTLASKRSRWCVTVSVLFVRHDRGDARCSHPLCGVLSGGQRDGDGQLGHVCEALGPQNALQRRDLHAAREGLHAVCGWRPADRGDGGAACARLGSEEHGIRAAETRVQPEIPDALHTSFPQQTGLRVELHRGQSRCGVSGPQSGGAEEEIRLQVPQTEGERHRAGLSGQRHLLPQRPQHVCHRYPSTYSRHALYYCYCQNYSNVCLLAFIKLENICMQIMNRCSVQ
uniref:Mitotic checkpoint protein BUB3-like n=1 Tax=Sinocyclocheilus rhinocerous TaxID=307959 RepID=A0A673N3V2_9TELE